MSPPPTPPPLCSYVSLLKEEGLEGVAALPPTPEWAAKITAAAPERSNSTSIDQKFQTGEPGGLHCLRSSMLSLRLQSCLLQAWLCPVQSWRLSDPPPQPPPSHLPLQMSR